MKNRLFFWFFVLCSMIGCGIWCALSRQEIYYDLYNYHFYNGWAFVHGKTFSNYFVTGLYTFFAPLLDSLTYLLITGLNHFPEMVSFTMGLFHGLIYVLIFCLMGLFIPYRTKTDIFLFITLFIYSVTGYALVRQLGVSSHEVTIAIIFLPALYLFFKNTFIDKVYSPKILGLIGFLTGAALGLKLTILPMCLALGGTVLFCALTHQFKHPVKTILFLSIGGLLGLLITDGWWMYLTWQQTGNPLFPSLNNIFQSPLLPAESIRDKRFLPQTVWEALFYPLYWIWGKEYVTDMNVPAYHFHAILPFICAVWLTVRLVIRKTKSPQEKALIVFYDLAYVAWLGLFSILRYAVILEALSGIIIFLALKSLTIKRKILIGLAGLILIVGLICPYKYSHWRIYFNRTYIPDREITVSDDTVVLVAEDLASFIIPFVKTKNPVLGWTSSVISEHMPYDLETIKTYRKILTNKKILVLSNDLKIIELLIKHNELLTSADNDPTIYAIAPDSWCGSFLILGGKVDEKGIVNGFSVPETKLDEFLQAMTAKNLSDRLPYKKTRNEI